MSRLSELIPDRDEAVDLAFSAALTAVALYAFQQSYGGVEYMIVGVAGVLLGCFVALVGNRRRLPAVLVVAALLVVYIVIGGAIALRDRALAGFLPSPNTVLGALDAIVGGWKELLTTVPPVGTVGNLMALPMFCGIVGAGAATLWANRVRALLPAALLPTAVMCLGLLCGLKTPVSVLLHGAVFGALLVVWVALRHRRVRPVVQQHASDRRRRLAGGLALVGVASGVGLVAGPSLPFASADNRVILRDTLEPPFDPFDFPSPLAGYRNYVKTNKEKVLFTITGLPKDVPIRMATMDDYDGVVWRVTGGEGARAGASGYFQRVGTSVAADHPGERATITIEVKSWTEVWIPTVGEVISIHFSGPRARALADAYRYNRATDTAASQHRLLRPGDVYKLDVVLPPSPDSLKDGALEDQRGKNTSNAIPEELVSWAAPQVAKIEHDRRPTTLELSLKDRGVYSDGLTPEQQRSLGGHSTGRMVEFIAADSPVGDAEQFASALGLMLRGDEIAARVVTGFKPRVWNEGPIDITGEDAEAWVEVPVTGVGWVGLFPTPDREKIKPDDKPKPRPRPERNTQVPPPPPVLAEDPHTEPAKEADGKKDEKKKDKPVTAAGDSGLPRSLVLAL
ncbi:MAG: transglutaminase domain-containing protein, partial [Ilumatobacteraceae bacterium]